MLAAATGRLLSLLLSLLGLLPLTTRGQSAAASTTIIISQVYGGGGTGATYTNDFIELHNLSATPQSLNGFSVQYTGPTGSGYTAAPRPDGAFIAAGGYYLIQLGTSGSLGAALPTPAATGGLNMGATTGKVLLASTTTAFSSGCPTPTIVDFVGYGTANCAEGTRVTAATGNAFSFLRLAASGTATTGCKDTNDNSADFVTGTPLARSSASTLANCAPANNPVPTSTSLSPSSVLPNPATQPLAVNGTNLLPASVVNFNGVARATTFVSTTQLPIQLTDGRPDHAGLLPRDGNQPQSRRRHHGLDQVHGGAASAHPGPAQLCQGPGGQHRRAPGPQFPGDYERGLQRRRPHLYAE